MLVGFCTAAIRSCVCFLCTWLHLVSFIALAFSENAAGSWPQEELEYSLNESQERLSCISSVTTSTQAWQDIVNYLPIYIYRLYIDSYIISASYRIAFDSTLHLLKAYGCILLQLEDFSQAQGPQ